MRTPVKAMLCSKLAIATALVVGATPAAAQSFQGTVDSSSGISAPVIGSGTTTIDVTAPQAIINWTATGPSSSGLTTFQSSGTTATFQGTNNFAVLNRVSPTVASDGIFMNGTINSLVNGEVGGSVYFYSPNGIVIGKDSSINVGSLGLTTLPISDSEGMWMSGFGTDSPQVNFGNATNLLSFVRIDGKAQVNANGSGNYVALVAPLVDLRGTIRTDGAAALVSASSATITFRTSNLYDIQVTTGSSNGAGVVVDGGTIERNSLAIGGDHRAYLVAVPANNAITMLVQGGAALGFDIAGTAGIEGNTVVLSAGGDVYNGQALVAPDGDAAINISSATVSSDFTAVAPGRIDIWDGGGPTSFSGNVDLTSRTLVSIGATNGDIMIGGDLTARADVDGDLNEDVTGGTVILSASGDGSLTIAGSATLSANGTGGDADEVSPTAGSGTGGNILVAADNGATLSVAGGLTANADGQGGDHPYFDASAGDGAGGSVTILASDDGGNVSIGGPTELHADGYGGGPVECSECSITGGDGQGGVVTFIGLADSNLLDDVFNSISFNGNVDASANGTGGAGDVAAGTGRGGLVNFDASDLSRLYFYSDLDVEAEGYGGYGQQSANGGAGFGGTVRIGSFEGAGGSIEVAGDTELDATGYGGTASGGGTGGNGTGGTVVIDAPEVELDFATNPEADGEVALIADGIGGEAYYGAGAGGNGFGGTANLGPDGDIDVASNLLLSAIGEGGYHSGGGVAGNGTGGNAVINLFGNSESLLTVSGTTELNADGLGGGTGAIGGGTGGNGQGGWSRIFGTGGQADFNGDVFVLANGTGGDAYGGTGGNGVGGLTRVNADGASYDFAGDLSLAARSTGGDGMTGGNALAFIGTIPKNDATTDARILARNGTITVLGATTLDVSADGGDGSNGGSGGNASSGYATVHARNSDLGAATITLGNLNVDASTAGGDGGDGNSGDVGGNGGTGGNATGGYVVSTASAGNGHLAIAAVFIDGTATGGAGGTGGNGEIGTGGSGGTGGAATGGRLFVGTENGESAALGINEGSASFASIVSAADAVGGAGGDGGFGTTDGVGGGGGAAFGGLAYLIARGSLAEVGDVTFTAHATGGAGGYDPSESQSGVGGNATAGWLGLGAFNRSGNTAMRGTINAGTVDMRANATGGTGSTAGLGYAGGLNFFSVRNSDVTMNSFAMLNSGSSGGDPTALVDPFDFLNGSLTVDGDFTVVNPTIVSLWADNATVDAGNFSITAGNFIRELSNPAPASVGTISADSITLISGQDVIVDAHLNSGGALFINVPGDIDVQNVNAAGQIGLEADGDIVGGNFSGGAPIILISGGATDVGSVTANGFVYGSSGGDFSAGAISGRSITLLSGGMVTADNLTSTVFGISINAVGSVDLDDVTAANSLFVATDANLTTGALDIGGGADADIGGNIETGNIDAGSVDFFAVGDIEIGDAVVSEGLDVEANGSLLAHTVTAGGSIDLNANLALVAGNLSAGIVNPSDTEHSVGIFSETSVQIGTVEALGWVGIASLGTINTLSIVSGDDVLLAADGNINVGAITTGDNSRLLIVGVETALLGDVEIEDGDDFDRSLVFAAVDEGNATPTGASVTIDGPVNGGRADIFVGQNFAGDAMTLADRILIEAGGSLTTGHVTAGDSIEFVAEGAMVTGNLSAGIVDPTEGGDHSIGLRSMTSIQTGSIDAADFVGMASGGTIQAGPINAGGDVVALAQGNASFGAITTGEGGRLLIAGFDMLEEAGGYDNPDQELLFQAVDSGDAIASDGSVTITGPVNTYQLDIFAGNNVTVGDLSLGGWGTIDAGGLLTLNGDINNYVHLTSNDIVVAEGVTVDEAQLVSRNAQGTFIGDGLAGTDGYRLSNAEFNRFGELDVAADMALGAGSTMTIGNLTVANAGNAEWNFAVGNGDGEGMGNGTIRVVGDVLFTGMDSDGEGGGGAVDFTARRFELDAATGSISLEDGSGGLAGTLEIEAQRVHVAEGSILSQLANDPGYAGLAEDLATPTASAAPDGVIRAGEIYIYLDDGTLNLDGLTTNAVSTYSVYVQNSGTAAVPAGFLTNYAEVIAPDGTPAGAIDLIVNGQIETEGGTLTGIDVRDALMEDDDPARFTATSTINGCALSGPCLLQPPPPPPANPTPDIQSQITLINAPSGEDLLFGNEETIEDNEEDGGENSATSPIQPPTPLFNTKPLEQSGETDEPVSGGGNPALIGIGINPVTAADDDDDDDDEENQ